MRSPARPATLAALLLLLLGGGCGTASPSHPHPSPPAYPATAAGPFGVGADAITVLRSGRSAFPRIEALLAGARRRVLLEMYELQQARLVERLVAARERGVAVTVIDDPTGLGSAAAAERLRAAGVDVVDYPVRRLMIDHVKLLVVDGGRAVVGGINWGDGSAANHDFDVLAEGPLAANLERVIIRDLVTCGRALAVPLPAVDPAALVVSTLPAAGIRPLVLDAIEHARSELALELFVLTDTGIVHALERAHSRGVAVHLLLDPEQRPSDPAAAALRRAGVEVRLYSSHGEKLHAKAMVADRTAVLFGSANWSGGGFERNHEVDVDLPDAPAVAAAILAAMDADWEASR